MFTNFLGKCHSQFYCDFVMLSTYHLTIYRAALQMHYYENLQESLFHLKKSMVWELGEYFLNKFGGSGL